MRRIMIAMLAATVLPVLGAEPLNTATSNDASKFSLDRAASLPTYREFLADVMQMTPEQIDALPKSEALPRRSGPAQYSPAFRASSRPAKCYYIRQANRNMVKPSGQPRLIPLADDSAEPLDNGNRDCRSDFTIQHAAGK